MNRNHLVEQPRSQPAQTIPPRREAMLLNWLENSDRMVTRDGQEEPEDLLDAEDPKISGSIDAESVDGDFELLANDEDLDLED